jgi:integrase
LANKTVTLYQNLKVNNKWTFRKVTGSRLRNLAEGAYYLSWYEGSKKQMQLIGTDAAAAMKAVDRKNAELQYIALGGEVLGLSTGVKRLTVAKAIAEYLADCKDRQGKSGYGLAPRTVEAYEHRLRFLKSFKPNAFIDEVDVAFAKEFRRFLRNHPQDLSDRTCHNIMQAVSTFLLSTGCAAAKPILKEMSFPPTIVIPYSMEEMRQFFAACTEEEDLIFKFFLHSMARKREVAFCEKRDLLFDVNVLHISPKPDKGFRLKGKRTGQGKKGRKVPIPAVFMARLEKHCEGKGPRDLLFPNGAGGAEHHFLRLCKQIAKRAGLANWEEFDLHRWRKTGATRQHEDGVSVRNIQARLGHESLEVTLDYLGVEDAADEFSQEQVNNGALKEFV